MRTPVQEPVTVPAASFGREHRTVTTHPAYGQIRASRVSGRTCLYGSDFVHHSYVTIRVCKSELHRDLSSDWIHGGDELIELSMSEAQWASFVTAMNIGDGVQCTLEYVGDERIPALPEPASRADQFASEMKRTVEASSKALRELSKEVEGMGLPKGKTRQILGSIGHALMQLESNAPYVAKRFDEHVEEGVEAAKSEIHGYMVGAMTRARLAAIASAQPPLVLEAK